LIKKCLFPAAGYGTRFLPATKAVPKEMLPILTKPLLQYGVEEALDAGINNMAIVTGRGKRSIEDHFDNAFELEFQLNGTSKEHYLNEIKEIIDSATFTYVRQQQMLGLGHAILTGEPLIGSEAFAVILADDLCSSTDIGVIAQMIKIYDRYQCSIIAIQEVPKSEAHKYGIVTGKPIDGSN
jgi:UTP--glucose-1-phosphate uridylyltransferase